MIPHFKLPALLGGGILGRSAQSGVESNYILLKNLLSKMVVGVNLIYTRKRNVSGVCRYPPNLMEGVCHGRITISSMRYYEAQDKSEQPAHLI